VKTVFGSIIHSRGRGIAILFIVTMLGAVAGGCQGTPVPDPDSDPTPPAKYSLSIASTAGGSVTTPGEGTFTYDEGTEVNLVALPEDGHLFVEWTGSVGTITNVNATSTTITMNDDYSVTANFAINQYTLTYNAGAGGSISGATPQTVNHGSNGTPVEAVPDIGYRFVDWSDSSTENPRTDTDVTGDITATANFAINQYTLTYNAGPGGSISGKNPQPVNHGSDGTPVEAVPDIGYHFVDWSDSSTENPRTDTKVTGDITVTANFAINTHDLTVDSTEGGSVTIPGEDTFTYDYGTVIDLVAEPDEHCHFVEWTGDKSTIHDAYSATTTITMYGDYSITANFILFGGGNGTAEDPYEIDGWHHLDNVRNHLDAHFILMNDLDSSTAGYAELASETANDGKGWQPIGVNADAFRGSFDGQGYEIGDLFINRPAESGVGLFGFAGGTAVVQDVGVVSADVTGGARVAGLVGSNNGTVSSTYSSGGSVAGADRVGGLVGQNEGIVDQSYSTCSVNGNSSAAGGLVGQNEGTVGSSYATGTVSGHNDVGGLVGKTNSDTEILNSYATGSVTGNGNVGGLVGKNDEGNVSNSYSTGRVTGTSNVGGLVGDSEGTVSASFWDMDTSYMTSSAGGTGKTTADMKSIITFAEWDICAVESGETDDRCIWNIVDGETYPFLSWLDHPILTAQEHRYPVGLLQGPVSSL
jgi:hypothetical protein